MREIGFTSWFSRDIPLATAVLRLAAIECKNIEIAAMPDYLPEWRSISWLLKRRRMHVTAVSLGVPFFYHPSLDLGSSSKAVRKASVLYTCSAIDFAARIGADIVYACSTKRVPLKERSTSLDCLEESVSESARYAEAQGVKFALEPFPVGELPTVKETVDFIERTQTKNLGVLIDSGHVAITGEPLAAAVALSGDRITHVHLNNNDGVGDLHWPPQKGRLTQADFLGFLAALKKQGYDGKISLEISKPEPFAETLVSSRFFIESVLRTV